MKLSTNWLKELMPELQLSAQEIAALLTNHSFETVKDREYAIDPNITVVKILKLEPHPNADRLRLATITDGENETRVVCGAPNISEGDVVPYSPPGTKVYDENGELFELSVAKIRGVESPGMLNSARELGLSSNHGGIVLLSNNTALGSKLSAYIPSDAILDADVLPDRARDVVSHVETAKELSAITGVAVLENPVTSEWKSLLQEVADIAPFMSAASVKSEVSTRTIAFNPNRPGTYAGIEISHEDVRDILTRLGFAISPPRMRGSTQQELGWGSSWLVTAPANRVDILGQHDIVDEVIRMIGYDKIPASEYTKHVHSLPVTDEVYWSHNIRELLVSAGFTETYSYSFEDEKFAKLVNSEIHPHVELLNPMAPELKKLRYSMLPGLISAMMTSRDELHRDKKGNERALFEIGRVYHRGDTGVVSGVIERKVIAGIAVGGEERLQEVLDEVCSLFKLESVVFSPSYEGEAEGVNAEQGRSVVTEKSFATVHKFTYAGEFFGIGYILSPDLLKKMKYRMPVIAFEISLSALLKHAPDVEIPVHSLQEVRDNFKMPNQFTELPKFPSVFRDVSILVSSDIGIDAVQSAINQVGGELVVDVDLFDEYAEEGASRKSLAFHIEYRSPDRTLTDKEISEIQKKIEHLLKNQFSAEIR